MVDAEREVQIAEFNAQSAVKKAEGDAKAKTTNAEADAMVVKTVGAAEAEKIKAVGTAEADVIKVKIESVKSDNYAAIEVARHLAGSGQKLVPDSAAGGGGGSGGTRVDVLLANVIRDNAAKKRE